MSKKAIGFVATQRHRMIVLFVHTETELSGGGDKTVHTRAETSVEGVVVERTVMGLPGGADSCMEEASVMVNDECYYY